MENSKCQLCQIEASKLFVMSCKDKLCTNCVLKEVFLNHLHDFQTSDLITINCYCHKGNLALGLKEIQEQLKSHLLSDQTENICQKHNCPAIYYCEDCSRNICNTCIKVHKESKVYHSITKNIKNPSSLPSNKKLEEDVSIKLPFKHTTFDQYSNHLDEGYNSFENKCKEYQNTVVDGINEAIVSLENYKKCFSEAIKAKIDRESTIVKIFKLFYQKFYKEINLLINKNDYKALESLCSINRMFSHIELNSTDQMIESIDQMKAEVSNFVENIKQIEVRYFFPAISRVYTNTLTLTGHTDVINCVALLKDGSFASGGRDTLIKIWTKSKGYQNTTDLSGHKGWISNLLLLNNNHLLSGSYDGTLKIWDPFNNFSNTHTLAGHSSWVSSALEFNNGTLISSSYDNTIIVRNKKNYQKTTSFREHTFGVFSLCLLPDNCFASGSGDKSIKIWNSEFTIIQTLKGQNSTVNCLALMNEVNHLASGGNDGCLKIWDYSKGECVFTVKAHNDEISCILILLDGRVVSGGADNLIKVWDNENSFSCTHILKGHSNVVTAVILTDEGNILSSSVDKIMKVWSEERKVFSD